MTASPMRIGFYVRSAENLGVEYLSAFLKRAGHETLIFFDPCLAEDFIMENRAFAGLLSLEDLLVERMVEADLDLAAFSVTTATYAGAIRVAQAFKKRTGIATVFGGSHVSCTPETVARHPAVDYAVVGEGEETLVELSNAIRQKTSVRSISNLCFEDDRLLIRNPPRPLIQDLDSLPFPDTDLFWRDAEGFKSSAYMAIASRGCPTATCTYCCNSLMKKIYANKGCWHRRRSVEGLLAELESARSRHSISRIQFWDDSFVDDIDWLTEFSEKYPARIGLPFFVWAHPAHTDREVAALLKRAGCREVGTGIQTVYEDTRRKYLRRYETNRQITDALAAVRETGIYLSTYVILQLPGQTLQEARDIIAFFHENPVDFPYVTFARYFPGTRLVDLALREGMLGSDDVAALERGERADSVCVAQPYDQRAFVKIRQMIGLTSLLPRRVVAFLIRNHRYEYLPGMRTTHYLTVIVGGLKGLLRRKRHIPMLYSLYEYCTHHARFVWIKIKWKLGRLLRGLRSGRVPANERNTA